MREGNGGNTGGQGCRAMMALATEIEKNKNV